MITDSKRNEQTIFWLFPGTKDVATMPARIVVCTLIDNVPPACVPVQVRINDRESSMARGRSYFLAIVVLLNPGQARQNRPTHAGPVTLIQAFISEGVKYDSTLWCFYRLLSPGVCVAHLTFRIGHGTHLNAVSCDRSSDSCLSAGIMLQGVSVTLENIWLVPDHQDKL